jgi:ABC-type polysaccharide/polyol phosphate transport system ATPase subunit
MEQSIHLKITNGNLLLPITGAGRRLFSRENLYRAVGGRIVSEKKKNYVQCLKDINIDLRHGDRLGLIGHNGAGKTSLLRVFSGIYPLGSGTVSIGGNVSTFISQGIGINPEMNSLEYLELQCVIHGYGKEEIEKFVQKVLDFIELGEFAYMPIRTYSSGMRARLLASAAIFFPCDILLVDEGIGAGDSNFSGKFNAMLDKLFEATKIMVVASHSNDLLKNWCNKGAVMDKGEIVYYGEIEAAISHYSCRVSGKP